MKKYDFPFTRKEGISSIYVPGDSRTLVFDNDGTAADLFIDEDLSSLQLENSMAVLWD